MEDHALIERIKAGDSRAFRALFERHKDLVLNVCYRLVGDEVEAEDLTQDVFFRIYKSVRGFRHQSEVSTWIYRIAVNVSLNRLRKRRRLQWLSLDNPGAHNDIRAVASENNPHDLLEAREREEIVWKQISLLPGNQRVVMILQRYEGLSRQQIAEIMECSVSAVQARLFRAKQNLYRRLLPYLKEI